MTFSVGHVCKVSASAAVACGSKPLAAKWRRSVSRPESLTRVACVRHVGLSKTVRTVRGGRPGISGRTARPKGRRRTLRLVADVDRRRCCCSFRLWRACQVVRHNLPRVSVKGRLRRVGTTRTTAWSARGPAARTRLGTTADDVQRRAVEPGIIAACHWPSRRHRPRRSCRTRGTGWSTKTGFCSWPPAYAATASMSS